MTKKIIRTRNSSFTYTNFNNFKCIINIKIDDVVYDNGDLYYYIDYFYNKEVESSHPFWDDKNLYENHSDGEIVYNNKMTTEMINHLLMNNDELSKVCGLGCPEYYKINIMKCLAFLWD